ncbi:Vacuolar protein sorting-associated protein 74 [Savitreella phatthalungensis]
MSGVTRRRGAGGTGGGGNGNLGDEDTYPSRTGTPSRAAKDETVAGGSPGNVDVDHKIAYDPQDLAQGAERAKQPRLTLMEEILLLGLKDREGYLSFWNDNISFTLRGCIVIELAIRGKISMQGDSSRRRFPLADRLIEVVDDRPTGETLLDEALKMMKASERMSVGTWIDLMSGETWNLMKIGYQLKQVRERLAKGLVDKGLLRTEKRNFLLFDMATHPIVDGSAKEEIRARCVALLVNKNIAIKDSKWLPESYPLRLIRTVSLVCAAYAANVLENALDKIGHESRERAFNRVDELLAGFSQWPFVPPGPASASGNAGANLQSLTSTEVQQNREIDLHLEVVAAVLQVFTRLDSIL